MTGTSGHPTSTCPQGPAAWPEDEQTGGSSSRYTLGVGLFSCGAPSMSGSMLKKKKQHTYQTIFASCWASLVEFPCSSRILAFFQNRKS